MKFLLHDLKSTGVQIQTKKKPAKIGGLFLLKA